jgi:hypothetical protein
MRAFLVGSPPGADLHVTEVDEPPRPYINVLADRFRPLACLRVDELPAVVPMRIWEYRLECITELGATYRFVR